MRILFVRLSAMGDVTESLGAVRALCEARPRDEFGFVTQRENVPLIERLELPIRIFAHDRGAGVRGVWRTGRELRRWQPSIALDLQGNWKSAGLAWMSRAKRRIGLGKSQRREPSSARLLTEWVSGEIGVHAAGAAELVVRAVEVVHVSPPRLIATTTRVAKEADCLRELGVDPDRPFRVFVIGVPDDPRTWPVSAIEREWASEHSPAVWLCGPAEIDVRCPDGAAEMRHPVGSIDRLVALGALVAKAGGYVVGPDQGATHVLAASGAPCRAMFGPQDPRRTAPRAAEVYLRADGPDCVPCRSRTCAHDDGPICMDFTTGEST